MPGAETGANVGARAKIWVKTGAAAWTEDRNGAQVFNFFGDKGFQLYISYCKPPFFSNVILLV